MTNAQNEVKEKKTQPKTPKVTVKQLEDAQNAYIVAHSAMTHKIISQDYSGRKITVKDKKEREQYVDNFRQHILSLNTLNVQFLYEQLQDLMKKSKQDSIRLYCDFDQSAITIEYDYFTAEQKEEELIYNPSENNDIVETFFADIPEHLSSLIIDMSYKVLTDDGAIYIEKTASLEDFMTEFDLKIGIEHTVEINV